jgi:hypothetical protein
MEDAILRAIEFLFQPEIRVITTFAGGSGFLFCSPALSGAPAFFSALGAKNVLPVRCSDHAGLAVRIRAFDVIFNCSMHVTPALP